MLLVTIKEPTDHLVYKENMYINQNQQKVAGKQVLLRDRDVNPTRRKSQY